MRAGLRALGVWLGLAAFVVLTASEAAAEVPAQVEGVVRSVRVRGTRYIEEAAVLARIRLRRGDTLTPDKIRADIASVYDTGFFDDVAVKAREIEGGVEVIYEVVEKPAVVDVRIEGNKKIDTEDLTELLDVRSYGVLNEAKVQSTAQALRDKYVEKGFYLAEITPRIDKVGTDRVQVVFEVVENRKVLVQQIAFLGNDNVPDRKIKRYMQTKEGGFAPWLTNRGTFDRDTIDADQQVVQYVYLEEGYVDVRVEPPQVYLSPDKRWIYASFKIDEGPRYDLDEVTIRGDFAPELGLTEEVARQIVDGVPVVDIQENQWRVSNGKRPRKYPRLKRTARLEQGKAFKYSTMEAVRTNLQRMWQDQGYAFVNVIARPIPDPETRTVDIRFDVDKGEKVRIGRIRISGNDPTFDKVVRREILLSEGDVYRGSLVDASRFRLLRTGFFEDVSISTPRGEGDDVLDLNVKVTEQPTGSFSLGLGYSTVARLQVNASIQKANFLGLGYNINAQIQWSALQRNASVSFFDPFFLDSRWTFRIDGFWQEQRFQFDQYQRGASIGIGRYLDRQDSFTLSLDYTIEDVGLVSLEAYRTRLVGGELFRNGLTSSVGLTLTLDRRNNRQFPTAGYFLSANVSLSGGFRAGDRMVSLLGGDFNFVESRFNFRFYQPLIPNSDWLVLRFNTSLGAVFSTDGRVVPFIHRFRAGGINSVRGFQWFSLGPTLRAVRSDDPTAGDSALVIGGEQSWVNNIELESPIIKAAGISLVVFFDAGNAFGDPWGEGALNPLRLRTAAGAGVRWRSPIGPLRFELGFPLKPREDERRSVFDFSIGSFF